MTTDAAPAPASSFAPPLALLLNHAADVVQAVRAGRAPAAVLAEVPTALRPGAQALAFRALRGLGAALVLRVGLVPKPPPPGVDALLLTALALLAPLGSDDGRPPYPDHTLVDQAVAAMRRRAAPSAGFANAVLRRFLREREARVEAARRDPVARLNHPRWWIDRVRADWPDAWEAILAASNRQPPMTLRVNARRTTAAGYVDRLRAAGLEAGALGGQAVRLARPCPVEALPGFAAGEVSVQDAAAQRAAPLLLGLESGWIAGRGARPRVLDACAAPGGKTAHLLELADLDLVALDSDATRLVRVEQTLIRLGLAATLCVGDAGTPATWWDGRLFDAILLDAPCSASGIVRRHPDVRWLRRESDIPALAATQARLLDALWPLLAPGGRLLYATCSIFRAEGAFAIDAFLQRRPDAGRATDPASPGHLLPLADNPDQPTEDGFYYALIEKEPS